MAAQLELRQLVLSLVSVEPAQEKRQGAPLYAPPAADLKRGACILSEGGVGVASSLKAGGSGSSAVTSWPLMTSSRKAGNDVSVWARKLASTSHVAKRFSKDSSDSFMAVEVSETT